jgi:uncharacterized PurR-regulated membrane protein YhhQ (DUF165 family)
MGVASRTNGDDYMKKYLAFAGFVATVPAANWMISNVGTVCVPDGPCLIPLGFGITAPSGVLMVGAALVLRDLVHEWMGAKYALAAVVIGAILSYFLANPYIALASFIAFSISELSDFFVYAKLRQKNKPLAILVSGGVGSVVDSVAFLAIAFGSLAFIEGQIIGKLLISALAAAGLYVWRKRNV